MAGDKTYAQWLQQLADEAGPDEAELQKLSAQVSVHLNRLAADLKRFALEDEDRVYMILSAFFVEQYGPTKTRVIRGGPGLDTIKLGIVDIGNSPGVWQVLVTWTPLGFDIYFTRVKTGSLRAGVEVS